MGLARITSWGQRIAFLVAVERIEADWEAESMKYFMLHCWQQDLEFLRLCADTLGTQVGMSGYRSAKKTRPTTCYRYLQKLSCSLSITHK
jgi:hypothetical protein